MKKSVIFLFVTILTISNMSAQESDFRKFRFGMKFDPALAWLKPNNYITGKGIKMGYNYGIMTDFFLGKNYAFATGLEVLNIGGKVEYPDIFRINDSLLFQARSIANIKYQVINIPAQLKMRTNEIGYMTYFAAFGFDIGLHFKDLANIETKYKVGGVDKTNSENKKKYQRETNFFRPALAISLGAEYNLSGNTNIYFGVKFSNGFMNTFTNKFTTYEIDDNGLVKMDNTGKNPVESQTKANAYSNYLSLLFGIFF